MRPSVPSKEILDSLNRKSTDLAEFEGVRSLIPGQAIMLTEEHGTEPPVDKPFLTDFDRGWRTVLQASDRASFATNILRNIQGFKNLRPVFAEPMRIGGQPENAEIRLEGPDDDQRYRCRHRAMDALQRHRFHQDGGLIAEGRNGSMASCAFAPCVTASNHAEKRFGRASPRKRGRFAGRMNEETADRRFY